MKRASTLVGYTAASDGPASESACSLRRRENRSESATEFGEYGLRSAETDRRPHSAARVSARPLEAESGPCRAETARRPSAPAAAPAALAERSCAGCRSPPGSARPL